jgi:predicted metal-dependent peptidase
MSDVKADISAARTYLAAKIPFLGFLTLKLRPRPARSQDEVPTVGVCPDGTLIYNEEFLGGLTKQEMRGVLCHEVMHPAMHVWKRQGNRESGLWNVSHDYAINQIIQDFISGGLKNDIKLPDGGCIDSRFRSMSAEEIYDHLEQDKSQIKKWALSGDCRADLSGTADGRDSVRGDQSAAGRLQREWDVAVVAAAQAHEQQKGRGSLPGGIALMIEDIVEPKVHWTDLLSRWLGENAGKSDLTYQRPSRRSESVGEILIGRKKTFYPDVTILWDTSGSMCGEEGKIFGEVAHMCEELDLRLRVIIIDAAIHADLEDVEDAAEIAAAVAGGGGSDFNPAFHRLDEESNDSVVIAFTDGYIGVPSVMPESLKATVWVITDRGSDPTNGAWGNVLWYNKESGFGNWD